jgi:hypothetical protein
MLSFLEPKKRKKNKKKIIKQQENNKRGEDIHNINKNNIVTLSTSTTN